MVLVQQQVLLRSALVARGDSDAQLARRRSAGDLVRLRRGAYVRPVEEPVGREEAHRLLLRATMPLLGPGWTLSHGSAAVQQGLPVWPEAVSHVHVTRPRVGGGRRRTEVHRHGCRLDPGEVVEVAGWPTTDLARTVVDLARSLPFEQGVAAADRALALGATLLELEEALDRTAGLRGSERARRVVAFADGRSESVGESVSRVLLSDLGLMPEDLQHRVLNGARLAGRVDFAWPELRTIGEFDGRVKYGRLLGKDDDGGDAVFREKQREDLLRELGWQVVRWVWADLAHPEVIAERLRRAFARAAAA
ncbi:hypothetical protein GCM10022197_31900 [Microlunatus spumicola]|uniref:Transcriptional regulator, AbiEi antitoxin, Type IV TA system n=1 Tax=Microlunatus spumicola TaxID=81499 RepID=A0ABP6XV21_9ACTN